MSLKPQPGTVTADIDRNAVISYQASYLADRFAIPLEDARSFVERFGLSRAELNKAVQQHLMNRSQRVA